MRNLLERRAQQALAIMIDSAERSHETHARIWRHRLPGGCADESGSKPYGGEVSCVQQRSDAAGENQSISHEACGYRVNVTII